MSLLRRLLNAAELRPFHPFLLFFSAAWVTGVRYLEEKAFIYDTQSMPFNQLGALISWYAFYLALGFGIAAILTHLAKLPWQKGLQLSSYGLTVAILPPLIDIFIYGRGNFSYRYQRSFFSDTTFLLFNFKTGLPVGEGLIVWGGVLLVTLTTWIKTQNKIRTFFAALLMYSFSLLYGVLMPGMAKYLYQIKEMRSLGDKWLLAWVGLTVALIGFLALRPVLLKEGWKRLPQVALAPSLVLLGAAWTGRVNLRTGLAALVFAAASLVFTLSNLWYDRREDHAGGYKTQVTTDDAAILYAWSMVLALSLLRQHLFISLTLLMFLIATYAYHGDPLRTKCVFPLSYKSEGFFAATAFLAGMLAQPMYHMRSSDALATFLIFGGFFLSAPFKDAKDIEGDRAVNVQTLYVVLEKFGWSFGKIHALAVFLLASCLLVPLAYLASQGIRGQWLMWPVLAAIFAVAVNLLPKRKLAVQLAVLGISSYLLLLVPGLLALH